MYPPPHVTCILLLICHTFMVCATPRAPMHRQQRCSGGLEHQGELDGLVYVVKDANFDSEGNSEVHVSVKRDLFFLVFFFCGDAKSPKRHAKEFWVRSAVNATCHIAYLRYTKVSKETQYIAKRDLIYSQKKSAIVVRKAAASLRYAVPMIADLFWLYIRSLLAIYWVSFDTLVYLRYAM